MSYQELYAFVTELLGKYQMDDTLFKIYLDIAQAQIEGLRPWRFLITEDATQAISPSDTFTSGKTIPVNFLNYSSMVLVDSGNNGIECEQIAIESKFAYKDTFAKYYCDFTKMKLYFCGLIPQAYAIHQFYVQMSPLVSANNVWVFPSFYHKLLALRVAAMWKMQVDYDVISAGQAQAQESAATAMLDAMTRWDANLQLKAIEGNDPYGGSFGGPQAGKLGTF